MSSSSSSSTTTEKKHPLQHLIAGGCAGFVESSVCHPLDTIKTRMQLRKNQATTPQQVVVKMRDSLMEPALRLKHSLQEPSSMSSLLRSAPNTTSSTTSTTTSGGSLRLVDPVIQQGRSTTIVIKSPKQAIAAAAAIAANNNNNANIVTAPLGPLGTARRIVQREGFWSLWKGLSAVYMGIIPKMAIRFLSFEQYKEVFRNNAWTSQNMSATGITFTAGLLSGLTEAILVVTPSEVCKVRMMGQYHSLVDPAQMSHRKYTNVFQTAYTITKEEGLGAMYKGLVPTMLRQGCNQAVNFTAYNAIKTKLMEVQHTDKLEHWQSLMIGGVSGGMGPLVNNPLDVVKTRLQKQVIRAGHTPKYTGLGQALVVIAKEEGVLALWKGITPRLLRIMPGQAFTFMTYEAVSAQMNKRGWFQVV